MRPGRITAGMPIHSSLIATTVFMALTFAATGQEKLVGIAAWNSLVGNTITGKEDDQDLVEYYAADGTVKSMLGNEIDVGNWALVGEAVCFRYGNDKELECYKVEVTGEFATFIDQTGKGTRYNIVKGNPKNL